MNHANENGNCSSLEGLVFVLLPLLGGVSIGSESDWLLCGSGSEDVVGFELVVVGSGVEVLGVVVVEGGMVEVLDIVVVVVCVFSVK